MHREFDCHKPDAAAFRAGLASAQAGPTSSTSTGRLSGSLELLLAPTSSCGYDAGGAQVISQESQAIPISIRGR